MQRIPPAMPACQWPLAYLMCWGGSAIRRAVPVTPRPFRAALPGHLRRARAQRVAIVPDARRAPRAGASPCTPRHAVPPVAILSAPDGATLDRSRGPLKRAHDVPRKRRPAQCVFWPRHAFLGRHSRAPARLLRAFPLATRAPLHRCRRVRAAVGAISHGGHAAAHERRGTTADHPRVALRVLRLSSSVAEARPPDLASPQGVSVSPRSPLRARRLRTFLGLTHALRAQVLVLAVLASRFSASVDSDVLPLCATARAAQSPCGAPPRLGG